jgi:trk system potassium uptake protein TrkH
VTERTTTSTRPALRRRLAARATLTPVRVVALSFAGAIMIGSALLLLPAATGSDTPTSVIEALFTATSAMCLTGLIVVDTPTHGPDSDTASSSP